MPLSRRDFRYALPAALIAQRPPPRRAAGRLLHLAAGGALLDRRIRDLPELLRPDDLLVLNDTRVIPARLFGVKASGGRVELLVERVLSDREAQVQIRASKPPKAGSAIRIGDSDAVLTVVDREGEFYFVRSAGGAPFPRLLEEAGHVPLPPYIRRRDSAADRERYQTVYARVPGAVAAPTAGLHFDEPLLARLRARGVRTAYVTLHVGAGTFQPVRTEELEGHRMHAERYALGEAAAAEVARCRDRGGRVIAVGTTVVRTLESAAAEGALRAGEGETRLFITPGYRFRAVDGLLTNFHLPESTLLMLVCAFGGHARVMDAYRHAVARRYRFYSYGDAMLVEPAGEAACASS